MLPVLHSAEQVRAMFPEGARPSLRRLKSTARKAGHCRVLGRMMAFTDGDVKALMEVLSERMEREAKGRTGESFVYFIHCQGLIKIGKAKNPNRRLIELQVHCPFPATIALLRPGDIAEERRYQEQFAAYRKNGEWFELAGELKAFLNTMRMGRPL